MRDNVTEMDMDDIKDRSVNDMTIDHIEELLELAKKGELRSILYVCAYDDNSTSSGWSKDERTHIMPLLGQLSLLSSEYNNEMQLRDATSHLFRAVVR